MTSDIPFRPFNSPEPDINIEARSDGSFILSNNTEISFSVRNIAEYWRSSAELFPDRPFLVQCNRSADWPELTYAEARKSADRVSSWLIGLPGAENKPIMILSGNSFEHALLSMGALQIGVALAPISPSYSLMGGDFARLKYVFDMVKPGIIFVQDAHMFGPALNALDLEGVTIVAADNAARDMVRFDQILDAPLDSSLDTLFSEVDGSVLAKILFTSGSTGMPKAVPNDHEMLCAAQKTLELISEPSDPVNDPMVVLDWLPWHHTYGGNVNFFGIARMAGTMYIDDGKPVPGLFDRTIDNLRRVSPTRYSSVPAAYIFLADRLEHDEELAVAFFKHMKICQYGGAALPQELFERMQVLAVKYTGMRIRFGTGWGSTETTGTGTAVFWETDKVGLIGVPTPGVTIKLVPVGEKFEVRIKGPNVLKRYMGAEELTVKAFDEEGFYCIGDAVKWTDPGNPEAGLAFDGRVTEDFKLLNGTWVSTGALRLALIDALDPYARDIVIAGQDRETAGAMIWPTEIADKKFGRDACADDTGELVLEDGLLDVVQLLLSRYNKENKAVSRRIGQALIMAKPPSVDAGEITDKQYVNQSAALDNRQALVRKLYDPAPQAGILKFD